MRGMSAPHSALPDVFDRTLLRRRLARAESLGPADFLLARAAEDLADGWAR